MYEFDEAVLAILKSARDILDQDGWVRGRARDSLHGGRCLAQAICDGRVLAGVVWAGVFDVACELVHDQLPANWRLHQFARHVDFLIMWNDVAWRSKEEVLELLDRTIAGLEAGNE